MGFGLRLTGGWLLLVVVHLWVCVCVASLLGFGADVGFGFCGFAGLVGYSFSGFWFGFAVDCGFWWLGFCGCLGSALGFCWVL